MIEWNSLVGTSYLACFTPRAKCMVKLLTWRNTGQISRQTRCARYFPFTRSQLPFDAVRTDFHVSLRNRDVLKTVAHDTRVTDLRDRLAAAQQSETAKPSQDATRRHPQHQHSQQGNALVFGEMSQ